MLPTVLFCCLLFVSSSANCRSSFELADGFSKWKKPEKIWLHETNLSHRKAFTVWKEAEQRAVSGRGIDAAVEDQIQSERIRWRDILKRIKYLVSQNLAMRGHEESLRR